MSSLGVLCSDDVELSSRWVDAGVVDAGDDDGRAVEDTSVADVQLASLALPAPLRRRAGLGVRLGQGSWCALVAGLFLPTALTLLSRVVFG